MERQVVSLFGCLLALPWLLSEFVIVEGSITCEADYLPLKTKILHGPIADYGDCHYWVTLPAISYDTLLRSECERAYGEVVDQVFTPRSAHCTTDPEMQTVKVQVDMCCPGDVIKQEEPRCYECKDTKAKKEQEGGCEKIIACKQAESCYSRVTKDEMVEKGCMSNSLCQYWQSHSENCKGSLSTDPFCVSCCENTLLCNEKQNTPKLEPINTGGSCGGDSGINPCRHGGVCTEDPQDPTKYNCTCIEGYTGDKCHVPVCHSRPCVNGDCEISEVPPYYRCHCDLGSKGVNCDEDVPTCDDTFCNNNGRCLDLSAETTETDDFRCLCNDTYVGSTCEEIEPGSCGTDAEASRRSITLNKYTRNTTKSCEELSDFVKVKYATHRLGGECIRHMSEEYGVDQYVEGVDGDTYNAHAFIYMHNCERSIDTTRYTLQVCCLPCASSPCQNGGYCIQRDAVDFFCDCRPGFSGEYCQKETSGCTILGDPHIYTYDGEHFYVQSNCLHTLVANLNPTETLPPFVVNAKFEFRDGNTTVSWPEFIQLIVYELDIVIDRDRVVRVNDTVVTLPWISLDRDGNELVTIYLSGDRVRLETDFDLVLEYDGVFTQVVDVPDKAQGNIQGLCGNYNGDKTDDRILPDLTDLTDDPQSDAKIAEFYRVPYGNNTLCNVIHPQIENPLQEILNEPDHCAGEPCQNGGLCLADPVGFDCLCLPGFLPPFCTLAADAGEGDSTIDGCIQEPCEHGSCYASDNAHGYYCDCVAGYTGQNCETDIDDCDPNRCLHGGRCEDGVNSFTCVCSMCYSGKLCEIDLLSSEESVSSSPESVSEEKSVEPAKDSSEESVSSSSKSVSYNISISSLESVSEAKHNLERRSATKSDKTAEDSSEESSDSSPEKDSEEKSDKTANDSSEESSDSSPGKDSEEKSDKTAEHNTESDSDENVSREERCNEWMINSIYGCNQEPCDHGSCYAADNAHGYYCDCVDGYTGQNCETDLLSSEESVSSSPELQKKAVIAHNRRIPKKKISAPRYLGRVVYPAPRYLGRVVYPAPRYLGRVVYPKSQKKNLINR